MKKDWSLWLAVALPFAMIVFVAGSIYLPRLWSPKLMYGFVYVTNDTANGYGVPSYAIRVVNGHLVKEETRKDDLAPGVESPQYVEPHLYKYDATSGESKSISFEEAQALKLDDRKKSPDDFEVSQGGRYEGPFGGGSEPSLYITGHSTSQKLDLRGANNPYDFEFIGWVLQ